MSDQDLQPYVVVERRGSNIVAFLCGALMGAGIALLVAPKSGRETQAELREGARRFKEGAGEKLTDFREGIEDRYGRTREGLGERVGAIRENMRDRQQKAEEAIKAGKDAARQARSDLEARVAESKAAYRAALAEGASGNGMPSDDDAAATGDASADGEEQGEEGDRESAD